MFCNVPDHFGKPDQNENFIRGTSRVLGMPPEIGINSQRQDLQEAKNAGAEFSQVFPALSNVKVGVNRAFLDHNPGKAGIL